MANRRRLSGTVTPAQEDAGLFQTPILSLTAHIIPRFSRNGRNDVIIQGFLDAGQEFDVVIAGRRAQQADPLLLHMRTLWSEANRVVRMDSEPVKPEDVRCPLHVDGAWRPQFKIDQEGWQTRRHQFLAANWRWTDQKGNEMRFGIARQ